MLSPLVGAGLLLLMIPSTAPAAPGDRFKDNDEGAYGESDGRNIGAGAGRGGHGPLPGIVIEGGGAGAA
ncbi:hypothetical protein GCM10027160_00350 [Streptomyces calidiresistens]